MKTILPPYFAYIGSSLSIIGGIIYWIDVVKGKTKPNIITWLFWTLIPLIAFIAQLASGVRHEASLTLALAIPPFLISSTGLLKAHARWKIEKFDIVMGILATVGVILWQTTKNPVWAVIFSVLADFSAALPTVIKTYRYPETESYMTFVWSGIGSFLVLLTTDRWQIENYLFSLYFFILSLTIVYFGIRQNRNNNLHS